jgi:hypothetical protein
MKRISPLACIVFAVAVIAVPCTWAQQNDFNGEQQNEQALHFSLLPNANPLSTVAISPSEIDIHSAIGSTPLKFWLWTQNPITDPPWLYINQGGGIVTGGWIYAGAPQQLPTTDAFMIGMWPDVPCGLCMRSNGISYGVPVALMGPGGRYVFSVATMGELQWTAPASLTLKTVVWDTVLQRNAPGQLTLNGNKIATSADIAALQAQITSLKTQLGIK